MLRPNHLTLLACLTGISVAPLLYFHQPFLALLLLWISGLFDVLDGHLARTTDQSSPQGAVLDILSDRLVEFAVILGLFFFTPTTRALPALLMLGSSYLCITSFLVVGIFSSNNTQKSFHYSPGLIERFEAFLFFSVMILFPSYFLPLAYAYTALVTLTALIRTAQYVRRSSVRA